MISQVDIEEDEIYSLLQYLFISRQDSLSGLFSFCKSYLVIVYSTFLILLHKQLLIRLLIFVFAPLEILLGNIFFLVVNFVSSSSRQVLFILGYVFEVS